MFNIANSRTNATIARQEKPYYVNVQDNGEWKPCEKEEALAISVYGTLYKLNTVNYIDASLPIGNWAHADLEDLDSEVETVYIYEEALGTQLDSLYNGVQLGAENDAGHDAQISDIENALCETSYQAEESIAVIEMALCESSSLTEERIDAIEQALCELVSIMEG